MTACAASDGYSLGHAHSRVEFVAPPEARCLLCGCPQSDHVPLRYALRVLVLHLLPARILRTLRPRRR